MTKIMKTIFYFLISIFFFQAQASLSLQEQINQSEIGAVLNLEPGIYKGNFEIKKPLEIRGQNGVIFDAQGKGTAIKIASEGVKLFDLEIRNSGTVLGENDSGIFGENCPGLLLENIKVTNSLFGIQLFSCSDAVLKNIQITGLESFTSSRRGDSIKVWSSHNLVLTHSRVKSGRDVILLYSDFSKIQDNLFEDGRYGIHFMYSKNGLVENNKILDNSVGIYVMYSHDVKITNNQVLRNRGPSGFGVALKESDRFIISNNNLVGNREAIHIDNSPISKPKDKSEFPKTFKNRISQNDIGILFVGHGEGLIFEQNDFSENWLQVSSDAGRKASGTWTNNYWSDYTGVDLNKDGFGEFPYRLRGLFNKLTERHEGFKIFDFGPTILALNFSEKLIPWFKDDAKLEDATPAIAPFFPPPPHKISYGYLMIFLVFSLLVFFLFRIGKL